MNEKDLRDCFAFMLTVGFAIKGEINPKAIWEIADMLVEARNKDDEEELGIAAVKPKRRYPKRPSDL
jgi:hypothetical protein